jgi:predicted DCC family thiol-disulfide oxidoreductase YuxK
MSAPTPAMYPEPMLLFDGDCGLCDRTVRFILRHERDDHIHFAALTSVTGRALLIRHGLPPTIRTSVVYIDGGTVYLRSSAILALSSHLRAPWTWLRAGRIVPRPLRDLMYRGIARVRYRVFGRTMSCMVPPPNHAHRFHD